MSCTHFSSHAIRPVHAIIFNLIKILARSIKDIADLSEGRPYETASKLDMQTTYQLRTASEETNEMYVTYTSLYLFELIRGGENSTCSQQCDRGFRSSVGVFEMSGIDYPVTWRLQTLFRSVVNHYLVKPRL